tara:strand:- start:95 stop:292 length:198 start_codon:yes stop_codon:yes gene_type:complete
MARRNDPARRNVIQDKVGSATPSPATAMESEAAVQIEVRSLTEMKMSIPAAAPALTPLKRATQTA